MDGKMNAVFLLKAFRKKDTFSELYEQLLKTFFKCMTSGWYKL